MKHIVLNSIVVVAVASAFVYLLRDPGVDPALRKALPESPLVADPRSVPDPRAPLVARPSETSKGAVGAQGGVDFEAIKARFGVSFDPMLVMGLGDFTDEEIDAYNALHVLPFNRAVGKDCEERADPQIPGQTYETCRTVREHPEHPYNDLDDEALRDLAVHDAVASVLLGRRTVAEEERLYWYLRAAALAEKSGPVMALAERRYGSPYKLMSVDGRVAPVVQPSTLVKRLALEQVAAMLGDPRAHPQRWRQALARAAGDGADQSLAQADALAAEFLQLMAKTQREVTGSVHVQELIDA